MPEIGAERAATLRRMAAAPDLHEYEALLLAHVEPVVLPAGLEWNESAFGEGTREQRRRLLRRKRWWSFLPRIAPEEREWSALFEAGLEEFNRACPGLAVEHDHGCVDLWIHYFPDRGSIEVPLDGWTSTGGWRADTMSSPRRSGRPAICRRSSQPSHADSS